jgi:hypothetical protein
MKPNNLQLALAQLAVGMLQKVKKQIWTIGAGQGKSRVASTISFLLLKTNITSRVHLVYSNLHLLKRDQLNFKEVM